ncbi:MAG: gamma-glutamyltransferase family protein, partial [Longimicrobiales bacterium]
APAGATAEFFHGEGQAFPPGTGPLAAVTPGTPGGLMAMLSGWGTMSLAEVLAPSIRMAEEGYPIEAGAANSIRRNADELAQWPSSAKVFLGEDGEAPEPGEIFRQPDLANTLKRLVEAERDALAAGASREEAIYAAYERFYTGDIAREIARGTQAQGGLITVQDLTDWKVHIEEPVSTNYRGFDVYKLTHWVQGPVLLQTLNILEHFDLESLGYNSPRYIHTLYQAMNLAFADRDFYYGDPYFPPEEPIEGLLSKEYAAARAALIDPDRNEPDIGPGDPYAYQEGDNPYLEYVENWHEAWDQLEEDGVITAAVGDPDRGDFYAGTTSIQAVDAEGWVVSVTPSGGWIPAFIPGSTGIGLSQRMQSFVLDPELNPYNVVEPGKRPRATLTPTIVLRDGRPWVSVAVQGGDSQDQNTLQFLLNMIHWDMDVQEAVEAANFTSYQMHSSFGSHDADPGSLLLNGVTPPYLRESLEGMGYDTFASDGTTSGPLNAVWFDWAHGSFWGGSSDDGDDYGIAW